MCPCILIIKTLVSVDLATVDKYEILNYFILNLNLLYNEQNGTPQFRLHMLARILEDYIIFPLNAPPYSLFRHRIVFFHAFHITAAWKYDCIGMTDEWIFWKSDKAKPGVEL